LPLLAKAAAATTNITLNVTTIADFEVIVLTLIISPFLVLK
jgi:hypothetical protein